MRAINSTLTGALLVAASVLIPGLSQAADAGSVTNVSGDVKIVRSANQLPVAVGTGVQAKDEIRTGSNGDVKWQMADGSKFGVPKDSRFEINDFSQKTSAGGGKAIFTFIKGAFRTVSGLVGKIAGDTYELRTPVATMGIRGTDYAGLMKKGGGGSNPDGLYAKVYKGAIAITNDAGTTIVTQGQAAYVKDKNSKAVIVTGVDALFAAAGVGADADLSGVGAAQFNADLVVPPVQVLANVRVEPPLTPSIPPPPSVPPPPITPSAYGAVGAGVAVAPNGVHIGTDLDIPAVPDPQAKLHRGLNIDLPTGQTATSPSIAASVRVELTPTEVKIMPDVQTPVTGDIHPEIDLPLPVPLPEIPASPS